MTLVADGSVLDESTVLDIARHLSNLLTNAVRNPGTPLSELVIVDDVDLDRIRNLTDPASRPSSIAGEHAGITSDFRLVVAEPNGMVCPVGVAGELFLVPVRSVLGSCAAQTVCRRARGRRHDPCGDQGQRRQQRRRDKVGFTAPSPRGQAAVIAEALAVGEVDPSTISYVETHGTATRVGDSIEVEALEEALSGAAPGPVCSVHSSR